MSLAPTQQSTPKEQEKGARPATSRAEQGVKALEGAALKALGEKVAPTVPSLEEMLTQATRDNPDVRVAEAKVREAEAELNRARLVVMQKVIELHSSLESQKAQVLTAEAQFKRIEPIVPH